MVPRKGSSAPELRTTEDLVPSDTAPADGQLTLDLDELERRAPVGSGEAPCHLPGAGVALDSFDTQAPRPGDGWITTVPFACWVELLAHHALEESALLCREARPVSRETAQPVELHRPGRLTVAGPFQHLEELIDVHGT